MTSGLFVLNSERYDTFMHALDNPPRAGTETAVTAAPSSGMAEVEDEPERSDPRLSTPVPLTAEHDLAAFDCGEPALNEWLRHRALKNESRFSRTYVVCEGKRVVAYFCISAGAVGRAAAPGKVAA